MVYHLAGNLTEIDWAPAWLDLAMSFGFLGVPLFFVISGFVIAQSTNSASLSGHYFGIFAAKRSIRLDPTYWSLLLISLTMLTIKSHFFPSENAVFPTIASFVAHVFYLQDLLGYPPISPVIWTLCLEIQFYLFFIGSRLLFERYLQSRRALHLWLFGVFIVSLLQYQKIIPTPIPGLFLKYWFLFYLGVACNWALFVDLKPWHFALVMVCALLLLGVDVRPYVVTGILSALFIYGVGCIQGLSSWLCTRPLIYLGSISYSLYLIHPEVGWSTISLLKHFFGTANSAWVGVLYFLTAIAVSIVAAHLLWRLVELPSNLFAKRFGARSRVTVPAPSQ